MGGAPRLSVTRVEEIASGGPGSPPGALFLKTATASDSCASAVAPCGRARPRKTFCSTYVPGPHVASSSAKTQEMPKKSAAGRASVADDALSGAARPPVESKTAWSPGDAEWVDVRECEAVIEALLVAPLLDVALVLGDVVSLGVCDKDTVGPCVDVCDSDADVVCDRVCDLVFDCVIEGVRSLDGVPVTLGERVLLLVRVGVRP